MRPGSCARATGDRSNGIAAALPMSVMNSRRLIALSQTEEHTLASFGARSAVHHSKISCPMSPSGQSRHIRYVCAMSASLNSRHGDDGLAHRSIGPIPILDALHRAAGFLTFFQQSAQPERYGVPSRFDTMPSQPIGHWRALRESNPCFRRERAASWTARRRARPARKNREGSARHIKRFGPTGKQAGLRRLLVRLERTRFRLYRLALYYLCWSMIFSDLSSPAEAGLREGGKPASAPGSSPRAGFLRIML